MAAWTWSLICFSFSGQITGGSHHLIWDTILLEVFLISSPDNQIPQGPRGIERDHDGERLYLSEIDAYRENGGRDFRPVIRVVNK